MQYRTLGKTGLMVSEVGFGAWGIGGGWGEQDDTKALSALTCALERGVNFFDTALAYGDGHSERLIRQAVRENGAKVVIASKIPPKNYKWPARHDTPLKEVFPRDWIVRCTERSLKHLETDCLDLQQLHVWSPHWAEETEWLEALQALKKQGKVRSIGVSISDHQPDTALKLVEGGVVDVLQVIYNLFDQSAQDRLFPLAQKHHVGILARCPLDEGGLSGVFRADTVFHSDDWRRNYFSGNRLAEVVERAEGLMSVLRDDVRTLSQGAMKFCLSHPAVSSVIPGMRRSEHVEENCRASDGKPFSDVLLKRLAAHRWERNFY